MRNDVVTQEGADGPLFEFNLDGLSVAICIPAYRGYLPLDMVGGLIDTMFTMHKRGINNWLITDRECAIISHARNKLVDKFLKETTAQKLLFIDDDIIFKWEDVERLLAWSTRYRIVCATYPMRQLPEIKYFVKGKLCEENLNEDGLMQIEGTGLGFTIIDRDVFDQLKPQQYKWQGSLYKSFFNVEIKHDTLYGEDILFFGDCIENGEKVWLDPMINLKHFGNHAFEGDFAAHLSNLLLEGKNA